MFKKFIQQIIESENKEDAIQNVYYGTVWNDNDEIIQYGIETAFEHEKITWKEYELLTKLIEKLK